MSCECFSASVREDTNFTIEGLLRDPATGVALNTNDVSSITYWIIDRSDGSTFVAETPLTVASVMYDDGLANGKNFLWSPSDLSTPGDYELWLKVTRTNGVIGHARGRFCVTDVVEPA